jgi:uncharacterized protein DUF4926
LIFGFETHLSLGFRDLVRRGTTSLASFPEVTHTMPHLLDVVALLTDVPAHGLLRGQVGTVVELLDSAYEVEFSDHEGKRYAELALQSDQLLILHHCPLRAA